MQEVEATDPESAAQVLARGPLTFKGQNDRQWFYTEDRPDGVFNAAIAVNRDEA